MCGKPLLENDSNVFPHPASWCCFIFCCCLIETVGWVKQPLKLGVADLKPDYEPGSFGFDPLGLYPKVTQYTRERWWWLMATTLVLVVTTAVACVGLMTKRMPRYGFFQFMSCLRGTNTKWDGCIPHTAYVSPTGRAAALVLTLANSVNLYRLMLLC